MIAVGRLKRGPERDLVQRYQERIEALGQTLGLPGLDVIELPESRARRDGERAAEEAGLVLDRVGAGMLVAFDERGATPSSEVFADRIRTWRDGGRTALACVVGGPDGLDIRVRQRADWVVSFGALTLPHQIVRVLVAEQLYRALTIIAGHPYHRSGLA